MKKLLSMGMAVLMLCALCSSVFAAEITTNTNQSSNMTVTYGVDESYTVTIPENIVINEVGFGSATVTASNVMLRSGTALYVRINGTSYADSAWHLTDVAFGNNTLAYQIKDSAYPLVPGDTVLRVTAAEAAGYTVSSTLNFVLSEEATLSGTYTDQLTFEVSAEADANSLRGTYAAYLGGNAELFKEYALRISDEDAAAVLAMDTDEEIAPYLYERYGVDIVPSESSGWIFYGGTPLLYHESFDEAIWACKADPLDEIDGIAEYIVCSKGRNWNYNIMFSFEHTESMPEAVEQWMRTYCIKVSEQTYTIRVMEIDYDEYHFAEGQTWAQWCNSFLSNSDFCIDADGYVRMAGCEDGLGYVVSRADDTYMKGSDLMLLYSSYAHVHDEP